MEIIDRFKDLFEPKLLIKLEIDGKVLLYRNQIKLLDGL